MYQAEIMALLFVAGDQGITESDIATLTGMDISAVRQNLEQLEIKLQNDTSSGIKLVRYNKIFKLVTKSEYADLLTRFFKSGLGTKLSQAALEVLSIVAYKQPITRIEIDEIRGVQSSGSVNTLFARKLIQEDGKKDVPGHPNLYVVTDYFFDYFGIKELDELPKIEHFENPQGNIDLFDNVEMDQ
ncbi:SMC-Scp complex subunit ScpB [Companilactobacillus sp.]|uniref:SMC-Scp complex subunit ScpB n=2 Tax=Companilactobacillus sp. TaxID=2767905 RepID=UPI0025BB6F2E|nr:SMC-Scp complex subunit ScpB [Companilactobacillus sp.]MCH4008316.1 SMC-Scp complex subunit ScpB [Companilactobacillus sp.]MCH4051505.1 SMC-Scp complex subunit ScpB [Companilactobacillus sp.]MCH4076259.1 SMC-Scp complex subunit ScpB [Companilactobacillus sp.]MCH4124834.1 SMC-Scp complex subunit ScpB [Companilactobacillus sp.]MCH4131376.1 SMC-Scp complex subunit ScpB [Companilactobacillus sp.]